MKPCFFSLLLFSALSLSAQQKTWELNEVVKTGSLAISAKGDIMVYYGGGLYGHFDPFTGKRIPADYTLPTVKNNVPGKRTFQKNGFVTKATDWTTVIGLSNSPDGKNLYQFYEENYTLAITKDARIITSKPAFRKTSYYGRKGYGDERFLHKLTGLEVKDLRTNTVLRTITTDVVADWEGKGEFELFLNNDETCLVQLNRKSGSCQLAIYNLETGSTQTFPLDYSIVRMQHQENLLMCITTIKGGAEQALYVWDLNTEKLIAQARSATPFPQMQVADGRLWRVDREAGQLTEYGFTAVALDSMNTYKLDLSAYGLTGKLEQIAVAKGGMVAIVPARENNKWILHNLRDKDRSVVYLGSTQTQAERDAVVAANAAYKKRLCTEGEETARQWEGLSYMGPNGRAYILDYNCEYGAYIVGYFKHSLIYGPAGAAKKMPHNYINLERAYLTRDQLGDDGKRVCTKCNGTPVGTSSKTSLGWTKRYVLGLVYYIKEDVVNTHVRYVMCDLCKGEGVVSK